jgi:hypothetical protein
MGTISLLDVRPKGGEPLVDWSGEPIASYRSKLGDLCRLVLSFLWRPAISLGAGAAHQRRPITVAQAVCLQKGLDTLLVVDDSKCARPVGAPQAALDSPGVEHAREGSQMSGNGYGSLDSVQAPVTLITAFLRFARSNTFGSSAQGCGGAGGTLACWIPR